MIDLETRSKEELYHADKKRLKLIKTKFASKCHVFQKNGDYALVESEDFYWMTQMIEDRNHTEHRDDWEEEKRSFRGEGMSEPEQTIAYGLDGSKRCIKCNCNETTTVMYEICPFCNDVGEPKLYPTGELSRLEKLAALEERLESAEEALRFYSEKDNHISWSFDGSSVRVDSGTKAKAHFARYEEKE